MKHTGTYTIIPPYSLETIAGMNQETLTPDNMPVVLLNYGPIRHELREMGFLIATVGDDDSDCASDIHYWVVKQLINGLPDTARDGQKLVKRSEISDIVVLARGKRCAKDFPLPKFVMPRHYNQMAILSFGMSGRNWGEEQYSKGKPFTVTIPAFVAGVVLSDDIVQYAFEVRGDRPRRKFLEPLASLMSYTPLLLPK